MTITAYKRNSNKPIAKEISAHVPGFADYLIEMRMLMGEDRVADCLKDMSDTALNSLGFDNAERSRLRGKA